MRVQRHDGGTYRAELTADERTALLWAVEVGRAVLLRDPDLHILARERAISPELLDELADSLALAGRRASASVPS